MRTRKLAVFTILACLLPAALPAQQREIKETEVHGHTMYTLLKPGDIPAVFEPKYIPVSNADEYYYPDEPLIAVVDGGEAKAFSTWHLDHHEVVNDYINGKAITVTW
jgi:hypothetical protein